jgi:hypothetical protein
MRIWGKLLCALGSHPCTTQSDDHGVWGECIRCHRRFGYVDRATLRRFAEAEWERRQAATPTAGIPDTTQDGRA